MEGEEERGRGEQRSLRCLVCSLSVFTEFPEALWSSSLCNARCAAERRPSVICHGRAGSSCRRAPPPPARRAEAATRELREPADPVVLLKA